MTLISTGTLQWLRGLGPSLLSNGALFVHGAPPDSVLDYISLCEDAELETLFQKMECPVCFVGHTHALGVIVSKKGGIQHQRLGQSPFRLDRHAKYIINAGSVGQPRNADKRATYVIWDTSENTVLARFITYDAAPTIAKIVSLGLPGFNAQQLSSGAKTQKSQGW